jgi:hypothetical protein
LPPPTADRRRLPRRIIRWIGPPLTVALLVRAVLFLAALDAHRSPLIADNWFQWDANLYLRIATQGVQFSLRPGIAPNAPKIWDGNACWFPGYPLLIRAAIHCGLPPQCAALTIAGLEQFLLLCLIWHMLRRCNDPNSWLTLAIAGFFPAAIFMQAPFPMSQAALFLLLQVVLLNNRRPILAGLAGGAAAFSHPSAVFAVAAPFLLLIFPRPLNPRPNDPSDTPAKQRRDLIIAGTLSLAGFAAVLLYDQIAVNAWDAFFKSQRSFGPHATTPIQSLFDALHAARQGRRFRMPAVQMWFLTIVVAQCAVTAIRRIAAGRRHKSITAQVPAIAQYDRVLLPTVLIAWAMPLSIVMLSPYRSHALLTIATPLLADQPRRAKILILLCAVYVSFELAVAYFKHDLY